MSEIEKIWIATKIIVAAVVISATASFMIIEKEARATFMESCGKDLKRYECIALWRSHNI